MSTIPARRRWRAQLGLLVGLEAQRAELGQVARGGQQPHDGGVPAQRGHRAHAHVDGASIDRDADPAVLGQPLLDDVQAAHHLDAGQQRGLAGGGQHHDVAHHAVDPLADLQAFALRLQVQVGGTRSGRVGEHPVDHAHGRRVGGVLGGVRAAQPPGALGQLLDQTAECFAVGLLGPDVTDALAHRARGDDDDVEGAGRGEHAHVVQPEHVDRVGHRDHEPVLAPSDRHGHEALGDRCATARQRRRRCRRQRADGQPWPRPGHLRRRADLPRRHDAQTRSCRVST
jgi:hypothetical protein